MAANADTIYWIIFIAIMKQPDTYLHYLRKHSNQKHTCEQYPCQPAAGKIYSRHQCGTHLKRCIFPGVLHRMPALVCGHLSRCP